MILSANAQAFTPVAVADATNFTSAGFFALQGGVSTQVNRITEIYMGGQATSSAPTPMILARDSTVGATLSVGLVVPTNPAAVLIANPPVAFTTATTKPQRSATLQLLQLGFNAFGGIVRWVAAPGYEIGMLGAAASFGEISLSCMTGGTPGSLTPHMMFEAV